MEQALVKDLAARIDLKIYVYICILPDDLLANLPDSLL